MSSSLKNRTIHGIIWSSIEKFSVQGIQFVLQILMARILLPEDYGIIAMLAIFIAISQSFVDSGFSNALIRKVDRTETDYSTVFYFNIVVGLFFYFILFFTSPFIAGFYSTPVLEPLTKVLGLSLFFNSLCVVQQARLTINLNFKTQAVVSLLSVLTSGTLGLWMAYSSYGVWALAVQTILQAALRMILFWGLAKWKPTRKFSKVSFKEMFGFGSKILASGLLDTIYKNIYTIIIGKCFSSTVLGYYSRADQFAQFPSSNLTGIMQRVTFPVLSAIQNEDERLRINYRKFLRLSAFIIFPLMIGLSALAAPFIELLLTDKWTGAIPLLQVICVAYMWYPIHAINLNLLQVKGRSDLFLKLDIIKKISSTVILFITVPIGVLAVCYGSIAISVIALVINTYYTGKLIKIGFLTQMRDILPIIASCIMMFFLITITISFFEHCLVKLIVGIVIGAMSYLSVAYFFRSSELDEILSIIKRK